MQGICQFGWLDATYRIAHICRSDEVAYGSGSKLVAIWFEALAQPYGDLETPSCLHTASGSRLSLWTSARDLTLSCIELFSFDPSFSSCLVRKLPCPTPIGQEHVYELVKWIISTVRHRLSTETCLRFRQRELCQSRQRQ